MFKATRGRDHHLKKVHKEDKLNETSDTLQFKVGVPLPMVNKNIQIQVTDKQEKKLENGKESHPILHKSYDTSLKRGQSVKPQSRKQLKMQDNSVSQKFNSRGQSMRIPPRKNNFNPPMAMTHRDQNSYTFKQNRNQFNPPLTSTQRIQSFPQIYNEEPVRPARAHVPMAMPMSMAMPMPISCSYCRQTFADYNLLNYHWRTEHTSFN